MFNNREEFLNHIRTAPNPKKVREQFLEELQEGKNAILEFRQELQKVFQERNPAPTIDENQIDKEQTRQAEAVASHMEAITGRLADIAGSFANMSAKLSESSDVLGRFK